MRLHRVVGAGLLFIAGSVAAVPVAVPVEDPDTRQMLRLPADERHLVLDEMRNFIIAMQEITSGLAREDMAVVAEAARRMGSGAANEIPPHVVAKLPDPFKVLAGKVHTTFDAIALDAESLGDPTHTVGQLSDLTQHCVACHAIYQVDRERPALARQ